MADGDIESEAHEPCTQEQDKLKTILCAAVVSSVTGSMSRQGYYEKVGLGMRPPAEDNGVKICIT